MKRHSASATCLLATLYGPPVAARCFAPGNVSVTLSPSAALCRTLFQECQVRTSKTWHCWHRSPPATRWSPSLRGFVASSLRAFVAASRSLPAVAGRYVAAHRHGSRVSFTPHTNVRPLRPFESWRVDAASIGRKRPRVSALPPSARDTSRPIQNPAAGAPEKPGHVLDRARDWSVVLVALLGGPAGVGDQAAEVRLAQPQGRAGGGDDVLLHHHRTHIVGAEEQR
jgi:hypothetical protein